jgi:hypothetical protein
MLWNDFAETWQKNVQQFQQNEKAFKTADFLAPKIKPVKKAVLKRCHVRKRLAKHGRDFFRRISLQIFLRKKNAEAYVHILQMWIKSQSYGFWIYNYNASVVKTLDRFFQIRRKYICFQNAQRLIVEL